MKNIGKTIGLLLLVSGATLIINPDAIFNWIMGNVESTGLYAAAIIARLVLGSILVIAAKESRFPTAIKIIGYISIIAALIFLFLGKARFQSFLSDIIPALIPFALLFALISIAIGGFLIYAFSKNKEH